MDTNRAELTEASASRARRRSQPTPGQRLQIDRAATVALLLVFLLVVAPAFGTGQSADLLAVWNAGLALASGMPSEVYPPTTSPFTMMPPASWLERMHADGLSDGVEVIYRMNPLDADMDNDGVNDGQEVSQGSNPFFPDQTASISPELSAEVSEFLTKAIELQIEAYRRGDSSIASSIMAGDIFTTLDQDITTLNGQGFAQISEIDYYNSYINDIRVINETNIEVDTCEVWSTNTYRRADGKLIQSTDPRLLPQTITIQKLSQGWFITQVNFFEAPSFCTS